MHARADQLPPVLRPIAADYASFPHALARQRTLLERHCYVILPDRRDEIPAVSLWRRLQRLTGRGESDPEEDHCLEAVPSTVARRLHARCEVARQLGRSSLHTRRLDSQAVAQLLHRCWSPELARIQRLREEIGAYTALVVGGESVAGTDFTSFESPALPNPPDVKLDADGEELLALGSRTLADLIAPGGCLVAADHLQLDGQYARVLVLTGYPRLVSSGWLGQLVETDLPIEVSLHVHALASAEMVRWLGVQIARLQASQLAVLRGDRVADPEREIALEDAERAA